MKLPTLLKLLQPDEYKELEKFLASPYHRASEQHLTYFKYLCKHHKGFDLDKAALELAYRRCFGKDSYTDNKLYNLMSSMAKQVEEFMVIKLVRDGRQNHLRESLLVQSLGQRKAGDYFRTEALRLTKELESNELKSKDDFLLLEQLYAELYFNPDTTKNKPQVPHLGKGLEQLDLYYATSKLRYAAEMLARERLFDEAHDLPLLDTVLHFTDSSGLLDKHPLLALYNRLVKLYLDDVTVDGFRTIQSLFVEKHGLVPKDDQTIILAHLINCGIGLGQADVDVNSELLSLYKLAIQADIIMDNGRITHSTFFNIVNLAVICNELDWANDFMKRFSSFLADSFWEPATQISTALVYHAKGELKKAQDCLGQEVFMAPSYDLSARSLLMKILFERYIKEGEEYEFLMAHLNAFEKYINNKQMPNGKKLTLQLAVRLVRKAASVKFKHIQVPDTEKRKLQKKLDALPTIITRNWLLEIIGKM